MSDIKSFLLNQPSKFYSEKINEHGDVVTEKYQEQDNYLTTGSIAYNENINKLVTTQQIDVDYSKFENHTFFNSAQANVNFAFDKIINKFPFDGTKYEIQQYIDSLTGFEKYVYDKFEKNIGYLNFYDNAYISVNDKSGAKFPTLSKNNTGDPSIDPDNKSFTIEAQIFVPPYYVEPLLDSSQIIFQKLSGSSNVYNNNPVERKGFTLMLSASRDGNIDEDFAPLHGHVVSGSEELFVSGGLKRGTFNHVAMVCDREQELSQLFLYINGQLISSSEKVKIGKFNSENHNFLIGSGSSFFSGYGIDRSTTPPTGIFGHIIEPTQTFSGSIDDLRIFHKARTKNEIKSFQFKSVSQTKDNDLKLYYKFNEPTGALGNSESSQINSIVLDSSGNSLHSSISNYTHLLRSTGSVAVPLKYEKKLFNPVLFPSYAKNLTLNQDLLVSASKYDSVNPNLITNLIPRHYFLEGEIADGVDEFGESIYPLTGSSIPGTARFGTNQILSSLLFMWAKQFDELKIVLDSFKTLSYTNYNSNDNIPNVFLTYLTKHYGFDIPHYFSDAKLGQLIYGDNLVENSSETSHLQSLQNIRYQLLRRFLANVQEIIKTKGTVNGLKMLIRTTGIDPDTTLNIRFFDRLRASKIYDSYKNENVVINFLDINSTNSNAFITSSYLSGSRIEPGYPDITGDFVNQGDSRFGVHGYSNNPNDGLFTSGSWTYEGLYNFPITRNYNLTQSLSRLIVTGSDVDDTSAIDKGIVANLVALSSSAPVLRLYVNSMTSSLPGNDPALLSLSLTGANIFDGNTWNISYGRIRNDKLNSHYSSSYFLRAATDENSLYTTSSLFFDSNETSVFENIDSALNAYGAYISIGNEQGEDVDYASGASSAYYFLNNTTIEPTGESRAKAFNGLVSNIKFWSKGLSINDWRSHVFNKTSLGVKDPRVNFNFVTIESGSFEKLRTHIDFTQNITQSNSDEKIQLSDFSQNNITFSGFNFGANSVFTTKKLIQNKYLVPSIDEMGEIEKVRVRSFKNYENVSGSMFSKTAPITELDPSEEVYDDSRLSIEFSIINALNKDIIKMFSSLKEFNNYVTSPELMYSNNYYDLETLQDVYFNRLTEKIYLNNFSKIFKYINLILRDMIQNAIPYKTKFLGTNLTIESHLLERTKANYSTAESYLDESEKQLSVNFFDDFNSST